MGYKQSMYSLEKRKSIKRKKEKKIEMWGNKVGVERERERKREGESQEECHSVDLFFFFFSVKENVNYKKAQYVEERKRVHNI